MSKIFLFFLSQTIYFIMPSVLKGQFESLDSLKESRPGSFDYKFNVFGDESDFESLPSFFRLKNGFNSDTAKFINFLCNYKLFDCSFELSSRREMINHYSDKFDVDSIMSNQLRSYYLLHLLSTNREYCDTIGDFRDGINVSVFTRNDTIVYDFRRIRGSVSISSVSNPNSPVTHWEAGSFYNEIPSEYERIHDPYLDVLEKQRCEWCRLFNIYGLSFMRDNKLYLFDDRQIHIGPKGSLFDPTLPK